jgi:DNA-binding MarR family transcriptional regulator
MISSGKARPTARPKRFRPSNPSPPGASPRAHVSRPALRAEGKTSGTRPATAPSNPAWGTPSSQHRLPPLLRKAWHGLNQAFRHRTAPVGLTPDQYTVLRILTEAPRAALTQGQLADAMSSDPNTIASMLRRMERQGLIARRRHPLDRRAHCLEIKPPGATKYRRLRRLALALQRHVLAVLPEQERDGFLAQLEAVSAACWRAARDRSEVNSAAASPQA